MTMKTMHAFVSGKVQGVSFRLYTQNQAKSLGLTGWVRNLSDDRVEVMAVGELEKLQLLQAWLHRGSPHAKVLSVECEISDNTQDYYHTFDILPTL